MNASTMANIQWSAPGARSARKSLSLREKPLGAISFSLWPRTARPDHHWTPAARGADCAERAGGIPYAFPETQEPPETTAPATHPIGPDPLLPTLRAAPLTPRVKPDRTLAWVSGGLGNILLLLSTGLGWRVFDDGHCPQPMPAPFGEREMDASRPDVVGSLSLTHSR